jgi:glycosyltransferase involved in cell wall biosynthesis
MKILFAYDNKFCRGEDGLYYSDGQFPYRLWQRYLEVFDEIVVAGRVRPLRAGERLEDLDLSSGPQVSFIEIPSISSPIDMFANRPEAARRIANALNDCDALIVRISEIGRLAHKIAIDMNKPWAVEVTGCLFDSLWHYGSWQGKAYAHLAAYLTKRMIHRAPFAIYVTYEFLQRRYPCKGVTVGCSDVQLVERDEGVLARRLAGIADCKGPIKIGLIGSLVHKHKGVATALEALDQIKDKIPPFEFCLLGNGDTSRWQKLATKHGIAQQTRFCGILPSGAAVSQWLDGIDIYIQPSLLEGLPRALVEAMSRGCPALASSAGGIPELLPPECIHRPGDSRTLAALLERAINDKDWRTGHAEANFRKAAQYDQSVLDPIRRQFWLTFIDFCRKG